MSRFILILALLAGAYVAYTEFGPRNGLPSPTQALKSSGNGRDTPPAAGIVNDGIGRAAGGIAD